MSLRVKQCLVFLFAKFYPNLQNQLLVQLKIKLSVWVVYKGRVHCIDGD